MNSDHSRGAVWRQWDFHIHTPASFEWSGGKRFHQMTDDEKKVSVDEMIDALNNAEPSVFVLMDYWSFDGWFELQKRLKDDDAPKLNKTVFPGIELRLVSPTKYRLNAHVVFSDDISNQELIDFKSKLEVALIERPLSDDCLIRLVREKVGDDLIVKIGHKVPEVNDNNDIALLAGSKCAEITCESYKDAINSVPEGKAVGFMPWDTNDGLAAADWVKHYSYVISLMNSSPIFETRKQELWAAFSGIKTDGNKEWFDPFYSALGNDPHLAVSGSDAHSFNDYGKFPNGKATWIKADPTFLGLLQTIKESAKRSYIGMEPQKLTQVNGNKTFFIDSISVSKDSGGNSIGEWLSNTDIKLNSDLVAIIGNKGSGKSALADVIALLGNCRSTSHFSFLDRKRFRNPPAVLAKNFSGIINWVDGEKSSCKLSDNPPPESVELVKYIPQAYFEELCNAHVSGDSDTFENELRSVIFSHADSSLRQTSLDFDQLIEQQESIYRDELNEYRKNLKKLNQECESIEEQLHKDKKSSLEKLLSLKENQISEHDKIIPEVVEKPEEVLTLEQKQISDHLEGIILTINSNLEEQEESNLQHVNLTSKINSIQSVRERLQLLNRQFKQFNSEVENDLTSLGMKVTDIISFTQNETKLNELTASYTKELSGLEEGSEKRNALIIELQAQQTASSLQLNKPQQEYQKYLKSLEEWNKKKNELIGTDDLPDSLNGIKERIKQLEELPELLNTKSEERLLLSAEIFTTLNSQRLAREKLFEPVQSLIKSNTLIRDEYKLQFKATLGGTATELSSRLFDLIKQNSGEFRGGDESYATIVKVMEKYDFNIKDDVIKCITELHDKIKLASKGSNGDFGISSIMRVNKTASEVYDLLYGLSFLEPRYTLLFQETQIEQLSPGQRGALLLIFYLLVDTGITPIILDQPEENLDNETVVSLLVPVLNEAKKRRQIIMVTHNPNLAVVCDAEQVIYSSFNRKNKQQIRYVSGSIENPVINTHVVNVLEGTKPAFINRSIKYH